MPGSTDIPVTSVISVSGQGRASIVPDAAFIDVGVTVMQPTVGGATTLAASRAQSVIDALADAGVNPSDIATRDYSVYPEYDQRRNQPEPRVVGYRVQNTVTVTIRDVAAVSDIIDQATAGGGDSTVVQNLRFGAADPTAGQAEARTNAWRSARRRAQQLARLAGVSLGPVVSISEGSDPNPVRRSGRMAAAEMSSAPPIEAGTQSVGVSIRVDFAIVS